MAESNGARLLTDRTAGPLGRRDKDDCAGRLGHSEIMFNACTPQHQPWSFMLMVDARRTHTADVELYHSRERKLEASLSSVGRPFFLTHPRRPADRLPTRVALRGVAPQWPTIFSALASRYTPWSLCPSVAPHSDDILCFPVHCDTIGKHEQARVPNEC